MSFLTYTGLWFLCGAIMSGVYLYNAFNKWNRGYATWGDIYIAIFILMLGPLAMGFYVIVETISWLEDRSDRIAFGKIDWGDGTWNEDD